MKKTENKEEIAELLQRCDGCAWDGIEECVKRPGQRCLMREHISEEDAAYLRKKKAPPKPFYIDRNQITFYHETTIVGGIERNGPTRAERDQIMSIPGANVRPVVEAGWVKCNNPNYSPFDGSSEYTYRCSNCGKEHESKSPFCEHCGASMTK